jgi:uncharacterized protein (UPF0335 family)
MTAASPKDDARALYLVRARIDCGDSRQLAKDRRALKAAADRIERLEREVAEGGQAYGRDVMSMARERNAAIERAERAEAALADALKALEAADAMMAYCSDLAVAARYSASRAKVKP